MLTAADSAKVHRMRGIALLLSLWPALLGAPGILLAQGVGGGEGYRIGPRDLIRIEVFELPELDVERRVSAQGSVRLPVLGDVEVEGKTESELATALEASLEANYVERATVTVEVLEYRSRSVTVMGAAREPGEIGLPGERTLLEVLTAAGGLAENHGRSIHVLRRAANGLSDQVTIPIDELTLSAGTKLNLPVFPGDVIHVERRLAVSIYLLGEVANPGVLKFDGAERATLLYAIARGGGLGSRASSKILIQRRDDDGEMEQISANYKRILAGKDPDPLLLDGDVVIVKESFF